MTLKDHNTENYDSEEERWRAVVRRDAGADPVFLYGVRSTGIYCRPSCASRRPGRNQVSFHPSPDAAEGAGFRACLRCRPREAAASTDALARVCRFIEANLDEALSLRRLSGVAGLSPAHFQRTFKQALGVTPREYVDACHLGRFKSGLRDGEGVTESLLEAGYGSTSRLYERAPGQLGMTPTAYRRGGREAMIFYALTDTPLGRMLVAATGKGVCAVSLGDSGEALEAALRAEYPEARLEPSPARLQSWVEALAAHLRGKQPDLALPLDIRATAFQRRVWQELQAIPYGETRSYGQVANALGCPTAARAVAQACAANPAALVIPCHRVVRGDGGAGGFRWGMARKSSLLAQEKADKEARCS